MKQLKVNKILIIMSCLLLVSCNNKDDIDEIFTGKIWYIHGACFNGVRLNSEIKAFYEEKNSYFLSFSASSNFTSSSFSGKFSTGSDFSGTWLANGSSRMLTLQVYRQPPLSTTLDRNLYTVLKNIKKYSGDSNVLTLYQDDDNYILFNSYPRTE